MSRRLPRARPREARRPKRTGPRLESLEDRRQPATFSPLAAAADGSEHSLRAAILLADYRNPLPRVRLSRGSACGRVRLL